MTDCMNSVYNLATEWSLNWVFIAALIMMSGSWLLDSCTPVFTPAIRQIDTDGGRAGGGGVTDSQCIIP